MQQGGLPVNQSDQPTQGADYFPVDGDQSGAVVRVGMGRRSFGGMGGSFRRGY